jgi:hypothetical protein
MGFARGAGHPDQQDGNHNNPANRDKKFRQLESST